MEFLAVVKDSDGESHVFKFPTEDDRSDFIEDIERAFPGVEYCINVD